MPLMIKLNRNVVRVYLCLDNGHFITAFYINNFFEKSAIYIYLLIIVLYNINRYKNSKERRKKYEKNYIGGFSFDLYFGL